MGIQQYIMRDESFRADIFSQFSFKLNNTLMKAQIY